MIDVSERCHCYEPVDDIYGRCKGTKEIDWCRCQADRSRCDFYPQIRAKALDKKHYQAEFKPLIHQHLKTESPIFSEDGDGNYFASCTNKILAQVIDTTDKVIIDAITKEAAAQGVNDLFLIDKEFIVSAIKHEMARRKGEGNEKRF